MIDPGQIKKVYFLGIGGIGMSALARFFKAAGAAVSGYDRTSTPLTDQLINEGIPVIFDDSLSSVSGEVDLVVYTPAISKGHKHYVYYANSGVPFMKRAEVLGMLTKDYFTIAIGGTHGKTTITSLVAHILNYAGIKTTAFIGGISKNFKSNILISKETRVFVVEADEFDKSFLQLCPDIALVSSVDADHLDIYGNKEHLIESFAKFISQVKPGGKAVVKNGLQLSTTGMLKRYHLTNKSDYFVENIRVINGQYHFDFIYGENKMPVQFGVPGLHNIENAVGAAAATMEFGIDATTISEALATYTGVVRRFDFRVKTPEVVYIDDYAHHPAELEACISSVRHMFPGRKITGIFQPHLYSRTRDFAEGFAKSLEMLDELMLLEIYPARELPVEGVSSEMLLKKINMKDKMLLGMEDVVEEIGKRQIDILLTLGAGDIDQLVEPVEKKLLERITKRKAEK